MCFAKVLPPSPSPCKWRVGGSSCCCTRLLLGTHHCHFTLFGVVASLLLLGLMLGYYVDCAMVRYYPLPLPCVGGGIPLQ